MHLRRYCILIILVVNFSQPSFGQTVHSNDDNGFKYEYVKDDPIGMRVYTLENGLKVYMAQNTDEPRIYSLMAIRSGSANEPSESTGLAHYLEHLKFSGTDEIVNLDWEKEKALLEQIENLNEEYRSEKLLVEKNNIIKKMDSLSVLASQYSIDTEFNSLSQSIGSVIINGFTDKDRTGYHSLIPRNAIEQHLRLISENFSTLVPRNFLSEMSVVFEEYNQESDNEFEARYYPIMREIFPNHPYGRPVIGTTEHLLNPSIKDLKKFYSDYYVPNNMALILVGDLEFDNTIQLVDKYFKSYEYKDLQEKNDVLEKPILETKIINQYSPHNPSVLLGIRTGGADSNDQLYITVIDKMLENGVAGIFDLEIDTKPQLTSAESFTVYNNDYGVHFLDAHTTNEEALNEAKDYLISGIDRVKSGDFTEAMLEAALTNIELEEIQEASTFFVGFYEAYDSFIRNESWEERVSYLERLKALTKEDIVNFAKEFYQDNYVILINRRGETKSNQLIKRPEISDRVDNRDKNSSFGLDFLKETIEPGRPEFIDYETVFNLSILKNNIDLYSIKNDKNALFELNFVFDFGTLQHKDMAFALEYLELLGTKTYSRAEIRRAFFEKGLNFQVDIDDDQIILKLNGPERNLTFGLDLIDHYLSDIKADEQVLENLRAQIMNRQESLKNDRRQIRSALTSYALYGAENPYKQKLYRKSDLDLKSSYLLNQIANLRNYEHEIVYFGSDDSTLKSWLNDTIKDGFNTLTKRGYNRPTRKEQQELLYFYDLDLVQADIIGLKRGDLFDVNFVAHDNLFNSYYANEFSHQMREIKSLAYTSFASNNQPRFQNQFNYLISYIGTQAEKLPEAINELTKFHNSFPYSLNSFKLLKDDKIKRYHGERIRGLDLYWSYKNYIQLGYFRDLRSDMYEGVKSMSIDELAEFYNNMYKEAPMSIIIVGSKKRLDIDKIKNYGPLQELNSTDLFGF